MGLSTITTQAAASGTTGHRILYDLNLKETGGSTAVVQLKDAVAGAIKREWNLAANESLDVTWENPPACDVGKSWYITIVSGGVKWCAGGSN